MMQALYNSGQVSNYGLVIVNFNSKALDNIAKIAMRVFSNVQ